MYFGLNWYTAACKRCIELLVLSVPPLVLCTLVLVLSDYYHYLVSNAPCIYTKQNLALVLASDCVLHKCRKPVCVKAPIQVVIVVSRGKAASGYAASFLPRILIIESFISQLEPALFCQIEISTGVFLNNFIMVEEDSKDWLTFNVRVLSSFHS